MIIIWQCYFVKAILMNDMWLSLSHWYLGCTIIWLKGGWAGVLMNYWICIFIAVILNQVVWTQEKDISKELYFLVYILKEVSTNRNFQVSESIFTRSSSFMQPSTNSSLFVWDKMKILTTFLLLYQRQIPVSAVIQLREHFLSFLNHSFSFLSKH